MIGEDTDLQAEYDLNLLVEADRIKGDPGRLGRAKSYADTKSEQLNNISERVFGKQEPKGFNGGVKNSSMRKDK